VDAGVIDWISKQDFSDGKVATTGASYDAITGLQAASHRPPALKAVFAAEPATDLVQDVAFRGGVVNVGILPFWLWLVNGLKRVPDVQSMALGTHEQLYQKWIDDRADDPTSMSDAMYLTLNARDIHQMYASPEAMMIAAGLTPPPCDVRDVTFLFARDNTFYPEHLNIDPTAPSWINIPTSDPWAKSDCAKAVTS
jgi:hypothetical protein